MVAPRGGDEHGKPRRPVRFWVALAGMAVLMFGIVFTIHAFVVVHHADVTTTLTEHDQRLADAFLGLTAIIVGTILLTEARLASFRVTMDEAYHLGEDVGYEKGFRAGRRVPRPVVVDLVHRSGGDEVSLKDEAGLPSEVRVRMYQPSRWRLSSRRRADERRATGRSE